MALHHRVEADGLVGPHRIGGFRPRVLGVARPGHGGSGGAVSHSDAEPAEALEALSRIRTLGIPQLREKGRQACISDVRVWSGTERRLFAKLLKSATGTKHNYGARGLNHITRSLVS